MAKMPEIVISLEKGEIAKLKLKDGDVLVFKIPRPLMRHAKKISELVKQAVPDNRMLIIPKDFELSVIEEEEADGMA